MNSSIINQLLCISLLILTSCIHDDPNTIKHDYNTNSTREGDLHRTDSTNSSIGIILEDTEMREDTTTIKW